MYVQIIFSFYFVSAEDGDVVDVVYRTGPKDLLAVLFYTLIMILGHAVIQEFVLDVSSIDQSWSTT